MSKEKPESAQGQSAESAEPVVLLDCGQASKVTKGVPYLVLYEVGWPPFDRLLY
jgi:hypothetical protein